MFINSLIKKSHSGKVNHKNVTRRNYSNDRITPNLLFPITANPTWDSLTFGGPSPMNNCHNNYAVAASPKKLPNHNKTSVQLMSDIHLEYKDLSHISDITDKDEMNNFFLTIITPSAPMLMLCGDVGQPFTRIYRQFMEFCSNNFERVFVVAGNHEYFGERGMEAVDRQIGSIADDYPNLYYLNNDVKKLTDQWEIIGTTLWTNIPVEHRDYIKRCMNDYDHIIANGKPITPNFISGLFHKNLELVKRLVEERPHKKLIIMSHHLPSFKAIAPEYKDSLINYAFASDLDEFIREHPNIKKWCFGHTHSPIDERIELCQLLCNPNPFASNARYAKQYVRKDYTVTIKLD